MPPPDSGKKLTAKQIELLRRWVEQGATWGKHWAFEAPRRPLVPKIEDARLLQEAGHLTSPRSAIDAFVLARLKQEKLAPSPEADRVTLLRRLSLDLIGLPPTADEVDAFSRTDARRTPTSSWSSGCWPRRTTASAGAGIWLDAARYADSDGYEKDKPRFVWVYRDWVIDALNRDLPYDQFVIEQIAGDLLPNADAGPARRHRLPAQLDDQRGRRHRSRAVPHGGDVRPHGRHRQEHARPDDPVRPVPQPQVRSADAGRLLPPVRLPQRHARGERRRLHARRAACGGPTSSGRSARSKPTCSTSSPDWRERMAALGRRRSTSDQPRVDRRAARSRRRHRRAEALRR